MDKPAIETSVENILRAIGEDPDREGLRETPKRVARMYEEMFSGLKEDPHALLRQTFKDENHQELVLLKDISFYSFCEHHLMPFWGRAHVGYVPNDGVLVGLSKLSRVVHCFAKRPQIQERLTSRIADCIFKTLNPLGAIVVIEAEHMCISMRGIRTPGSTMITSALRGIFHSNAKTRAEVMSLIMSSK